MRAEWTSEWHVLGDANGFRVRFSTTIHNLPSLSKANLPVNGRNSHVFPSFPFPAHSVRFPLKIALGLFQFSINAYYYWIYYCFVSTLYQVDLLFRVSPNSSFEKYFIQIYSEMFIALIIERRMKSHAGGCFCNLKSISIDIFSFILIV